ncbi:ISAzo13-like element transposase-related protein [Bathymodiolus platifrons methanotrophic gill symbiont]|uniref:ISAzo13-like element transposase-related protein n=1 Tax=Bathymodiolus platifrons methanotrophic gill symbiont TaxID=113268 RepID=UPI0021E100F6|nr:hypothetical protein [Bathymodiolus platifrons methanotrophic gill symbiont]
MLQQHTAGNPMNSSIRWTYLKPREIVSELLKKGYSVSRNIVRYLLKKHEYVRGVAIFAKACFGHPSPSKQQKLNATTYASGGPDSSSSPRPDPTRGRNIGSK